MYQDDNTSTQLYAPILSCPLSLTIENHSLDNSIHYKEKVLKLHSHLHTLAVPRYLDLFHFAYFCLYILLSITIIFSEVSTIDSDSKILVR